MLRPMLTRLPSATGLADQLRELLAQHQRHRREIYPAAQRSEDFLAPNRHGEVNVISVLIVVLRQIEREVDAVRQRL